MNLPSLKSLLAAHGIEAKRKFGQNFLLNADVTDRIASFSQIGRQDCQFLEIGPGPGGLTRSLLAAGVANLHVIEKDFRFLPLLEAVKGQYGDKLTITLGDALKLNLAELAAALPTIAAPQFRLFGNLPYNIATPLLFGWLEQRDYIIDMVLMFQKEVADRLTAPAGSEAYGRISVMVQLFTEVDIVMNLSPHVFTPPPKVDSALVKLVPRRTTPAVNIHLLQQVTSLAFGQRRKMLRRSLSSLGPKILQALEKANIAADRRGETLTPQQFVELCQIYERLL